MIDILVNFNTGYIDRGIYIKERIHIAKKYVTGWFIIDFITALPIALFINSNLKTIRLIRFIKIIKILKFIH